MRGERRLLRWFQLLFTSIVLKLINWFDDWWLMWIFNANRLENSNEEAKNGYRHSYERAKEASGPFQHILERWQATLCSLGWGKAECGCISKTSVPNSRRKAPRMIWSKGGKKFVRNWIYTQNSGQTFSHPLIRSAPHPLWPISVSNVDMYIGYRLSVFVGEGPIPVRHRK